MNGGEQQWVATLDVEKAFDRVHHSSLFDALVAGEIDASMIAALSRLYADLHASIELWSGEILARKADALALVCQFSTKSSAG